MKTGDIIKRLRKERKHSQMQLANYLGYSDKSSISKIENNEFELSQDKLVMVAKLFNVSVDSLINNDNTQTDDAVTLVNVKAIYGQGAVDIIESYTKLNDQGKKKAVEAVADLTEIEKYRK